MVTNGTKSTRFQPGNQLAVGHGAPVDNVNAATHGLKATHVPRGRRKLSIGKLPKGCSWINTLVSTLRRELEALTIAARGEVGIKDALSIQSACRHEQAALLAQRWFRLQVDTMTHGERLQYLTTIAGESDKRDKCVERLNLETDDKTITAALYGAPATPLAPQEATA